MLDLAQKGEIVLRLAPFFAFGLGVMWQHATWQLKKEQQNGGEDE